MQNEFNGLCNMYILEINSLSVLSFAIIFSHSEGCLFTLLVYSFLCCAKALKFKQMTFVYFVLISITLRKGVIEDLAVIYQRMFCLCFPLRVFFFPPFRLFYSAIKKNTCESVLMGWMKLSLLYKVK